MDASPPPVDTPSPPPEGVVAGMAAKGDPSTHFAFTHKIFMIEHCRFALNGKDKLPCFCVPIGDQVAAIELRKLQQEFNIPLNSTDAALLMQVEKGLKYVRDIRPGDSIPREILDGSASWSVEEEHKEIARARMNMGLIFWVSGVHGEMPPLADMQRAQKSPEGREQIRDAHVKLAQLLGLKDPRMVATRLEQITRETPYIEALRMRSAKLSEILNKLSAFATSFRKENAFIAENMRMQDLVRRASRIISDKFDRVDHALREIPRVAGDPSICIALIREMRDEISSELNKWDDYLVPWTEMKIERSDENEKFFRRFYQFLAENYMEQAAWGSHIGAMKK